MDLVWEYQHAFGRLDPRTDSWAKFLSGVHHTARFTARQIYAAIVGPSFALSSLSSEGAGDRMMLSHRLEQEAFGRSSSLIVTP